MKIPKSKWYQVEEPFGTEAIVIFIIYDIDQKYFLFKMPMKLLSTDFGSYKNGNKVINRLKIRSLQ